MAPHEQSGAVHIDLEARIKVSSLKINVVFL